MTEESQKSGRKNFVAGSTLSRVEINTGENAPKIESLPINSWCPVDSSSFHLRTGPDYSRTKAKIPSGAAYYELIGVDFVKTSQRIDDIGSKVIFPESWLEFENNSVDLPPIFILNAQVPSDFSINFSFFADVSDGEGWSLVFYFKLTQDTINLLQATNEEIPAALKLLRQYCNEAPSSFHDLGCSSKNPWAGRFKAIGRIENIDDYNLPNFITNYNGKPVLIKQTGTLIRGKNYLEMDISLYTWGNLCRQALNLLFYRFGDMVHSVGFCIESLTDQEMPENIFGCAKIIRLDPVNAVRWDNFL